MVPCSPLAPLSALNRLAILGALVLGACAVPDRREGHTLAVNWGVSRIDPDDARDQTTARLGVGYGFGEHTRWAVTPAVFLTIGEDDSVLLSGELQKHLWLAGNWVLTPSTGAGYFEAGDVLELHNELQFRSGLELSYRFAAGSRLGVGVYHVSNAGLRDENPGADELVVSWTLPMP